MRLISQISKYTRNKYLLGATALTLLTGSAFGGTLEGIIRNNDTNTPIQNVMVKVKKGAFSDSTTTDTSGHYLLSSLPDDMCEVLVGKNGYKTIDATQFAISGATAGNAKMIPDSQVVNGETVYNDADEITQISGTMGGTGLNPYVWDISANPSAPQKKVQLNGWTPAESTAIWNYLNDLEAQDNNRDWFVSGAVTPGTTEGIVIEKNSSNYNLPSYKSGFIFNQRVYLSSTDELTAKHEFGHVWGFFDVSYSGSCMGPVLILPTNKDISYLNNMYNWNLSAQNNQNNFGLSDISDSLIYNGVAGSPPEQTAFPFKSMSLSNYPNPAKNNVTIKYKLPENTQSKATLKVYNITGQLVKQQEMNSKSGENRYVTSVSGLANGVYIYNVTSGKLSETKKMNVCR